MSQAQHLRFFKFMFELGCEKDENKQKEALTGPYLDVCLATISMILCRLTQTTPSRRRHTLFTRMIDF